MDLHPDLTDLLTEFENFGVEYLVVGGWAVSSHAKPRYTKDLDVWIGTAPENLERAVKALAAFGAPAGLVAQAQQMSVDEFLFFGTPPARIDVLRSIPGATFEEAWARRARATWGMLTVNVIALEDLIATKLAAGRPQDLSDVKLLESARGRRKHD